MATNETQPTLLGDVVKYELPFYYCRELVTVDLAIATKVGSPLDRNGHASGPDVASLITSGNEANADAVCLEKTAASAADRQVIALVRGPCLINEDALELEASVTLATVVTALAALDIHARSESTYATLN